MDSFFNLLFFVSLTFFIQLRVRSLQVRGGAEVQCITHGVRWTPPLHLRHPSCITIIFVFFFLDSELSNKAPT